MNFDYEKRLAASVQRELNTLAELSAPREMAARVMGIIQQRAAAPWYRRAWQTWPRPQRVVALAVMLTLFAGLCVGSWQFGQSDLLADTLGSIGERLSMVNVLWGAMNALGNAITLAIQSIHPLVIIGGAVVMLACYAACMGLGTVCVRLAWARR
ncbi:MAG: hypothetical protein IH623_30680 [Verrucomicrobia bacterium]|nr:hypothetical protein [Verrucomicrobiota bacterium]